MAMLVYLAAYTFMNLGAFAVLAYLKTQSPDKFDYSLKQFAGLGRRSPWAAVLLSLFLLSLTGIPGTAGFIGKFYVFGGDGAGRPRVAGGHRRGAERGLRLLLPAGDHLHVLPGAGRGTRAAGAHLGEHGGRSRHHRRRHHAHRHHPVPPVGRGGQRVRRAVQLTAAVERGPCARRAAARVGGLGGDVLLLADWVIPVSSAPLADAGVRVAGGAHRGGGARRAAAGPASRARRVRTFPGCALLPGFVNSHTHLELSAFRGFARPSGFGRWMLRLLLARRKLDRGRLRSLGPVGRLRSARAAASPLWPTPPTTGSTVARAAAAAGLRARVYQEVFGLDDADSAAHHGAARGRRSRRLQDARPPARLGRLVEAGVSPHAPYTVSRPRLYREAARFARRAGLRLATHVAESHGRSGIARPRHRRHSHGLPRSRGLWTGAPGAPPGCAPSSTSPTAARSRPRRLRRPRRGSERATRSAILAASGAAVAHCPRSNARLRCGVAPVAEFLAAGVPVGLGTDSLASNDSLDMFAEMRAALAAAAASGRRRRRAPRPIRPRRRSAVAAAAPPLTPEQVLRMATLEGARALGWGQRHRQPGAGQERGRHRRALAGATRLAGAALRRPPAAGRHVTGVPCRAGQPTRRPTSA